MTEHDVALGAHATIDPASIAPPGDPVEPHDDAAEAAHLDLERHVREGIDPSAVAAYRGRLEARLRARFSSSLAWPPSWYIPTDADFREHWIVPPPADHRYAWEAANTIGGASAASHASRATGRLFAWCNLSALDPPYVGFARTGALVRPSTTLATYDVGASIDLVAEWRWRFEPDHDVAPPTGTFHYRTTAYVVAWQVSPVTGGWELVRPFGARTLVDAWRSGLGSESIHEARHALDDLHVRIQLEGGRTYAIGVSLETTIAATVLDRAGRPYRRRPRDDLRIWSSVLGDVPRVTVRQETVWIP